MSKQSQASLRRGLRVMELLSRHSIQGLRNADIAKALDESPANVSRTLTALAEQQWATKQPDTGLWTPSIKVLQLAMRHSNAVASAQDRLLELNQRVAAGAY